MGAPTLIESNPALPIPILPALQQALMSTDPLSLTALVRKLLALPQVTPFTSFIGPDGQPLLLGTLELFSWGSFQNNFVIEDGITTMCGLHGLNPAHFIPQALLQPLLERDETPHT